MRHGRLVGFCCLLLTEIKLQVVQNKSGFFGQLVRSLRKLIVARLMLSKRLAISEAASLSTFQSRPSTDADTQAFFLLSFFIAGSQKLLSSNSPSLRLL